MTCSARTALGPKLVALTGGVGGAKLIVGFSEVMAAGDLTVIANTGDDFEHLGFSISPDIDTLMYTLAGLANPETGWGRAGETWSFMDATAEIGGETWFRLGDKDIAVRQHESVTRTAPSAPQCFTVFANDRRARA